MRGPISYKICLNLLRDCKSHFNSVPDLNLRSVLLQTVGGTLGIFIFAAGSLLLVLGAFSGSDNTSGIAGLVMGLGAIVWALGDAINDFFDLG